MDNFIKEFWESNAKRFSDSHWASWGDNWAIDLEIKTIANYIENDNYVLDVGCANGYSTFRQASDHNIKVIGVDYAKNMIQAAKNTLNNYPFEDRVEFQEADILNLPFKDNTFDITYTTRVIINLPNWQQQVKAIAECIRVTKPNGKVILSEAFWEPFALLNSIRLLKQLPPLAEHDFNRYLKINKVEEYLIGQKINFEFVDFSSIYYLGSRFLRELVTNVEEFEGYSNPINEKFYELELEFSGGGFGIQQAIVIDK